ncbi:MAG: hypothetical protein RM338_02020 [Nostoc sp. DedQUE12a]|nr:hypothetical protein [Nostoc sp. DedQUE12a]
MTQKSRSELQGLFKTGTKPSQQDFADFIESTLNIKDDGIEKPSGAETPLKITAQGTDEKLMDFYAGETKTWSLNQKADKDKIGLNISNSGGSKLFITSSTGNVGIGTTTPGAKLEVNGDLKVTNTITGKIDTANITSGILAVERIPNLSATKIISGILAVERIPNLSADKITSGTISGTLSVTESLRFGASIRQMINLWNENYGIGIQNSTQYFRSDKNFAWYKGGAHNDTELNPGDKGTVQMVIKDGNVGIGTSDPGGYKLSVEGNQQIKGTLTITNSLSVAASAGSTANIDLSGHVQLKEYSTQNIAFFQARDDSSNRDIGLRIRTQKKGDSKPSIVDAVSINPDGNMGIGTTIPDAKLDVDGSLKAGSLKLTTKLISVKKYSSLGDNINYKTDYSTSKWICSIAGFYSGPGDINEGTVADIIQIYTYPNSDGWWYIRADVLTHNKSENWTIWLMAINKDIAEAANPL